LAGVAANLVIRFTASMSKYPWTQGPWGHDVDLQCRRVLFFPPTIAWRRSLRIVVSANPRWRLAGIAGWLLPGSHNGGWS